MKLAEALRKNGGYAHNSTADTTIQVNGEWGYAPGELNGSLVVYALDMRNGQSTRSYPEVGQVASLTDVECYLATLMDIARTGKLEPNAWE